MDRKFSYKAKIAATFTAAEQILIIEAAGSGKSRAGFNGAFKKKFRATQAGKEQRYDS